MLPAGIEVEINAFVAAGCMNTRGRIMCAKQEVCCVDGTAGQELICAKHLVRYMVESCNHCWFEETWFCEFELTPVVITPNP